MRRVFSWRSVFMKLKSRRGKSDSHFMQMPKAKYSRINWVQQLNSKHIINAT